jgi:hypothetical protein
MPEYLGSVPNVAVNGVRIGIQQKICGTVSEPVCWIERSVDARGGRYPKALRWRTLPGSSSCMDLVAVGQQTFAIPGVGRRLSRIKIVSRFQSATHASLPRSYRCPMNAGLQPLTWRILESGCAA